jgi:hypothetical protein
MADPGRDPRRTIYRCVALREVGDASEHAEIGVRRLGEMHIGRTDVHAPLLRP